MRRDTTEAKRYLSSFVGMCRIRIPLSNDPSPSRIDPSRRFLPRRTAQDWLYARHLAGPGNPVLALTLELRPRPGAGGFLLGPDAIPLAGADGLDCALRILRLLASGEGRPISIAKVGSSSGGDSRRRDLNNSQPVGTEGATTLHFPLNHPLTRTLSKPLFDTPDGCGSSSRPSSSAGSGAALRRLLVRLL